MTLRTTGTLHPNRRAGMAYLERAFVSESAFPLAVGNEFVAQIAPNQAVVLLPEQATLEYPVEITLYEPGSYRLTGPEDS